MIIQCKSCQKKFNVPDSAITDSGRLVQCSSCGNKWTQFPIQKSPKKEEIKVQKIDNVVKSVTNNKKKKKKKKKNIKPYSEDYLKKKHGIKIIDPSKASTISNNSNLKIRSSYGFYNTVLTLIVLLTSIFGVLILTEQMIVEKYPFFEIYIDYLFETINNFRLIFEDLIKDY